MSENPAASINGGFSASGPIGVQIVGRRFDDLGARNGEGVRGLARSATAVAGAAESLRRRGVRGCHARARPAHPSSS
jgi:hypothetical protein